MRRLRPLLVPALAAILPATGLLASVAPAAAAEDAIVIRSAGMHAWLPDDRDASLRRVLQWLPARLAELPGELPDAPPLPPNLVRLLAEALTGPMTIAIGADAGADAPAGAPPFTLLLSMEPRDPAVAEGLAGMFGDMARQQGIPLEPAGPGMFVADGPPGRLMMGLRGGDVPSFVIALNTPADRVPDVAGHGLPDGVEPVLAMRFDTRRLGPILGMIAAQGGGGDEMLGLMEQFGLGGPDALVGTFAHGHGGDRAHTSARLEDYAGLSARMGVPRDRSVPAAEFAAIPRDAVLVTTAVSALPRMGDMLESFAAAAGGPADPWADMEAALGFHPRTDLLDHLGDIVTVYRSDATGGGGLLSTVGLIGLADPGAIARTHEMLVRRFNTEAAAAARGYVSIRPWTSDEGFDLFTLSFNGIPVPLQITWGIEGSRLVLAGSPMGAVAAMQQLRDPQGSFADRAGIRAMAGGSFDGLVRFAYVDTPRAAAGGYGLASLISTALANAVRSPGGADGADGAGGGGDAAMMMPMPTFARFIRDVVPQVTVSRWDGDDLVTRSQSDRSLLVSVAGAAQSAGGIGGAVVAAGVVGAVMPALEQARSRAEEVRAGAQVRNLAMALQVYAADRDGAFPASLDDLAASGYVGWDMLSSPYGPSFDGPDYGYRRVEDPRLAGAATAVVLVDRAMLMARGETQIAYGDTRVAWISERDLAEELKQPINEGAAEALGVADLLQWIDE